LGQPEALLARSEVLLVQLAHLLVQRANSKSSYQKSLPIQKLARLATNPL